MSRDASNVPTIAATSTDRVVTEETALDEASLRKSHLGSLNDAAIRLLRIMGRRGNWKPSDLAEKSTLSVPERQYALLRLELEGRIRRQGYEVDPI